MTAAISSATAKVQCFHCHKPLDKVYECARCHIAKYCGKECQTAAWKGGHKAVCAKWQSAVDKATAEADQLIEGAKQLYAPNDEAAQQRLEQKKGFYAQITLAMSLATDK